ncbi:MAG: hypothetical protein PHN49_05180, partial [Candidatus Omnitrophica bacterium]|nr:hypothetical protein [Candidatus Omnitrophota bacterium]
MKNILIVEDKIDGPMQGYDHVFSFRLNPADSFPDDYISAKEISAIYHSVYDGLAARLLDPAYDADFSDQGIKLLWCFKKELFDYAFTLALRYDVLKRVLRTFQGYEVFLPQPEFKRGGIQLASVVKKSPLAQSVGFHPVHLHEEAVPVPVPVPKGRRVRWPEYFSLGNLSKREVAVFSDFERSKSVLQHLKRRS